MPRRGVPMVVSVLTCALLAGSVYAAERVGVPVLDRGAAAAYVPEDGTAAYARVERPGQAPVIHVVESTRGTGLTLISGLTFVLGIGWDFLTGSGWANRSSRAFPTPTRVLLLVVKLLLPAILLTFSALTREPSSASDLDAYARLGNLVLGTALLAAAYVAVLQLVVRDQALAPDFATRVSPEPGVSPAERVTGVAESGGLAEQPVQPAAEVVHVGQRDPEGQPDR